MERPYRSKVGVAGAAIAGIIAAATLVTLFVNKDYNKGVIGAAVWLALGIVYHAVHGRRGLVLAPEEEAAFRERGEAPPV
jgi:ethanolamine permease